MIRPRNFSDHWRGAPQLLGDLRLFGVRERQRGSKQEIPKQVEWPVLSNGGSRGWEATSAGMPRCLATVTSLRSQPLEYGAAGKSSKLGVTYKVKGKAPVAAKKAPPLSPRRLLSLQSLRRWWLLSTSSPRRRSSLRRYVHKPEPRSSESF